MSAKRSRKDESEWVSLTTFLDQDFAGMIVTETMPRRAYEFLKIENPSLDMRGSLGKTCDAAFNDLKHTCVPTYPDTKIEDWFTSDDFENGAWRKVLDEYDLDDVLADLEVKEEKFESSLLNQQARKRLRRSDDEESFDCEANHETPTTSLPFFQIRIRDAGTDFMVGAAEFGDMWVIRELKTNVWDNKTSNPRGRPIPFDKLAGTWQVYSFPKQPEDPSDRDESGWSQDDYCRCLDFPFEKLNRIKAKEERTWAAICYLVAKLGWQGKLEHGMILDIEGMRELINDFVDGKPKEESHDE